jgi:hypothetical protein
MTKSPLHTLLDSVRFEPERAMQAHLLECFGVTAAAAAVPEDVRRVATRERDEQRASSTRLTTKLAPGLMALLDETMERLELKEKVELYVDPAPEINASAYCGYGEDDAWIVTVTSGAVRLLDDKQLQFLLGHELGHHAFGHGEFSEDLNLAYQNAPQSDLLTSRLRVLERLQELSADRAGAMAQGGEVAAAADALLRVHTGLGPEDLRLDLGVFLEEIERLEAFDIPDKIGLLSHPLLPLRVRALQLHLGPGDREQEVLALARMMDYEARDEKTVRSRDLLLAGGLLAAHSDGTEVLTDGERTRLVELILPFTDDPEGHLVRLGSREQAEELYMECAAWIRDNLGPERYDLFNQLVDVVLFDSKVTEEEREFLLLAAEHLEIPVRYVEKRLEDHALETARQTAAPKAFGLRG